MHFTTPAYRQAAYDVMLGEVNRVIDELKLDEPKPLTTEHVREVIVDTPFMTDHARMFAVIKTDRYVYSAAISNKLCFIMRSYRGDGYARDLDSLLAQGNYPVSELKTNVALALARQWLAAAHMDVAALDRECQAQVRYWKLGDTRFVPLYWVIWSRNGQTVANVDLFEPGVALRTLRVSDDRYNLRPPLRVENREQYLDASE